MTVIALPRNRGLTHPAVGLRIDWSNPITRGLVYCLIGDMVIDLATGKLSSRSITNGSITNSVTKSGVGLKFSGANSVKTSRKIMGNGDASILLVGDPASESNGRSLARLAGGIGEIYLVTNSDHAGGGGVPGQMCWLWLQSGVERSAILVPSAIDGKLHSHVITKSAGSASAFVDGVRKPTSIYGSLVNAPTSAADTYQVGGNDQSSATSPNCTINANFVWNRRLADGEAAQVSKNPLLIFASRPAPLFVPVSAGGGSALAASATGAAASSGSAALAAQVALAGIGVSSASGLASASISIPLAAAGVSVSGGSANAKATVTITAAGLAQAAGQAGLSASVLLAGAGAAAASGNATLAAQLNALASGAAQASGTANLSGGAPGALNAAGQAQATGTAALVLSIELAAAGSAQASGAANLTSGNQGSLAATGQAQATGAAYPTIRINTSAAGAAVASGNAAGTLSAGNQITAFGTSNAAGNAALTVTVTLTAAGFVQAMGAGGLAVEAPIAASGIANAAGSANLAFVPDYLPVAPLSLVAGVDRPTRLHTAARRPAILRHEVTRVYQY